MRKWICASLLASLWSFAAAGESFDGVVTLIFDGDSFLVRPGDAKEIDVRLADIDAPEKHQPYGDTAKAALRKLIEGREVHVEVLDTDQYRRKVARVYRMPDRFELGRALVHDGHVWVNRKWARDRTLIELEDSARQQHIGLWATDAEQLVPPWKYRYLKRRESEMSGKSAEKSRAP